MNDLSARVARLKLIGELLSQKKKLSETPADARIERLKLVRRMLEIRKILGEAAPPAETVQEEPHAAIDDGPEDATYEEVGESRNPAARFYDFNPNRKPAQRRRENAAAIALLRQIRSGEVAGDSLTDDQKAVLARYSGLGGNLVSEGEQGSDYEYYTPKPIAAGAWDLLKQMGFSGGKVLDPCGGVGVFGATAPESAAVDAVELSETSGQINGLVNQRPGYNCTVSNFEKVAASTPDEVYDAVVANVPFGGTAARGSNYRDDPKYQDETLEGYFILRSLEKLRPGGLAAFICPPRVVSGKGGKEESVRFRASLMAEFMGAYRLPSHLFLSAGAETVTDLLVFRKHSGGSLAKIEDLALTSAGTLREARVIWGEFVEGAYFAGEGRRFVLGEFKAKDPTKFRDVDRVISDHGPDDIAKLLRKFGGSRIDWALITETEPDPIIYVEGDTITQAGRTLQMRGGAWEEVQRTPSVSINVEAMCDKLRDPLRALRSGVAWPEVADFVAHMHAMSRSDGIPGWLLGLMRGMLRLPSQADRARFFMPAVTSLAVALVLERTGGAHEPVNHLQDYPDLSEAMQRHATDAGAMPTAIGAAPRDAARLLRIHYNRKAGFSAIWRGDVVTEQADDRTADQRFEAAKYAAGGGQWVSREQAGQAYGADFDPIASPDWCVSPDGRAVCKADDFFVGNLADMLTTLRQQAADAPDDATRGKLLAMIEEAKRRAPRFDVSKVSFTFASPFVTRQEKLDFLLRTYGNGFFIDYSSGEPAIRFDDGGKPRDRDKYLKRLAYYVEDGTVTLQGTQFDRAKPREALAELRRMAMEADERFGIHCRSSAQIAERLEKQANDPAMLNFPQTTDETPLPLPGWKLGAPPDGVTPHPYQWAEIRRRGRFFGGINGYSVGLGKSFTALACVQHAHNVGIKKRTAIVVPNSVLSNWQKEARVALADMDTCLFVGLRTDKNGRPKMDTGAYDADLSRVAEGRHSKIFMTSEAFRRLRLRDDTLSDYLDSLGADDAAMKIKTTDDGHINRKSREKVAARGSKLGDAITKGHSASAPYLEDLGIDSLVIDEAHAFKNAVTLRDFKGAKFLSIGEPSAQGNDAQAKAAFIRGLSPRKDGVLLLTATPITNSPAEIYSMLSLAVGHRRVNDMALGVKGPDQFMDAVCDVRSEQDETIDGIIRDTRVFRGLRNVDILRRALGDVVTIETAETAGQVITLPDADERPTPVALPDPPTIEKLKAYKAAYRYAVDNISGRPDGEGFGCNRGSREAFDMVQSRFGESMDLIGSPFNMIRKMTAVIMDPELDELATFYTVPDGQEELADKVIGQFNALKLSEERQHRGPNTPADAVVGEKTRKVDGDTEVMLVIRVGATRSALRICIDSTDPATQDKFEALAEKAGLGLDVTVPPKLAAMLANFRREEASPRGVDDDGRPSPQVKQIIFCDLLAMHNKIRRVLSKHAGVPAGAIAIVTGRKNNKPEEIIEVQNGFNAHGEENRYRVIIANEKAEVGINLQRGTQAIHHLTIGWTPDSLTQRNGRGVRQGNRTATVSFYHYDADGTFDVHKRRLVAHKAAWIDDVMDVQGNGTVEIAGQISAQQQEALMETVGDADAMRDFTVNLDREERAARVAAVRDRQQVSLKTITATQKWIKENSGRNQREWAGRKLMELWQLMESADKLRTKAAMSKSDEKSAQASATLESVKARIAKLSSDFEASFDMRAFATKFGDPNKTPAVADLIKLATPSYMRGKPSLGDFSRQLILKTGEKYEDATLIEGSPLHSDHAAEIANAEATIEAARKQFATYSKMTGGAPDVVADLVAQGKGSLQNGVPMVDGAILIHDGGRVDVVVNGGDGTLVWSDRGVNEGHHGATMTGIEVVYPGTPEYASAAARAAAFEDDMIAKFPGATGRTFADVVPEIAQRRKTKALVPVTGKMLPAPLFPRFLTAWDVSGSDFLAEIRSEQLGIVQDINGEGFVDQSVALQDMPPGLDIAAAILERARAKSVRLPLWQIERFLGQRSVAAGLRPAFVGDDDFAEVIGAATSADDVRAAARAWLAEHHPAIDFSAADLDHPVNLMRLLDPTRNAAFNARVEAIKEEEAAARKQALTTGPDDQMVGINGQTFQHKDMIKEMSLRVAGEAAKFWKKGGDAQWNVRRKVWHAIAEKHPDLVSKGIMTLTEYRN